MALNCTPVKTTHNFCLLYFDKIRSKLGGKPLHVKAASWHYRALWGVGRLEFIVNLETSLQNSSFWTVWWPQPGFFNPLNRRSYVLGAGCVDSRLIWGSVRRVRSIFERNYFSIYGFVIKKITISGSKPGLW